MKARCKCGHIFDVPPELEGKRVRCPGCQRVVLLPVSKQAPPPLPPEAGKGPQEEEGEGLEFDWGEEFSLEGEPGEKEARAQGYSAARGAPAGEAAAGGGLEFESAEFHLDLGPEGEGEEEEAPLELGPGQILGMREGHGPQETAVPSPQAPAPAPAGEMKVCPECGRVITEQVIACPECGARLSGTGARGRRKGAPVWAGSLWGGFLYAYPAVLAGGGWQAWLKYAFIGAFLPNLVIFIGALTFVGICVAVPLAIAISFGSILGGMYLYMSQAAARGPEPLEDVRPRVVDDMILPFFLIAASSMVLVIAPIVGAGLVARATGALPIGEMLKGLKGGAQQISLQQIVAIATASGVLIAGILFGLFCFPMVVMLLGASQKVLKSLNPINVFKAIAGAPGEYVVGRATASFQQHMIGGMVANFVTMAIAVYVASATGWRMGLFLYRNERVFDHVR